MQGGSGICAAACGNTSSRSWSPIRSPGAATSGKSRPDVVSSRPPMSPRARRLLLALIGEQPRTLLFFVSPTLLAVLLDFLLRPRSLLAFEPLQWLNYFGSSLASAGFWGGPLWLASRL